MLKHIIPIHLKIALKKKTPVFKKNHFCPFFWKRGGEGGCKT